MAIETIHPDLKARQSQSGKSYIIDELLKYRFQPFADLSEDELEVFGEDLDPNAMAVPVVVSSDGWLLDGSQRLRVLKLRGVATIPAADVKVMAVTKGNGALEMSIQLNANRRQLTGQQKAWYMQQLQTQHGYSQGVLAKLFGMKQPSVSELLKRYANDGEPATALMVMTQAGHLMDVSGIVSPPPPAQKKPPNPMDLGEAPPPWAFGHAARKSLQRMLNTMAQYPLGPNSDTTSIEMLATLRNMIDVELDNIGFNAKPDEPAFYDADEDDVEVPASAPEPAGPATDLPAASLEASEPDAVPTPDESLVIGELVANIDPMSIQELVSQLGWGGGKVQKNANQLAKKGLVVVQKREKDAPGAKLNEYRLP